MTGHHLQIPLLLVAFLQLGTEGQLDGGGGEGDTEEWVGRGDGRREVRSLLGGERTELCPAQCLCLSEIQVFFM